MFDTILGIPAHPLLIHAAVIFIPLLVVGAIVFAAWPAVRGRIDWAVTALAVVGPFSALFSVLSGRSYRSHLINLHASATLISNINVHMGYGTNTLWWTIALGVVTLAIVGYAWRAKRDGGTGTPGSVASGTEMSETGMTGTAAVGGEDRLVRIAGIVLTVVLGGIVGYYVFRTGDTGAHIVWKGTLP